MASRSTKPKATPPVSQTSPAQTAGETHSQAGAPLSEGGGAEALPLAGDQAAAKSPAASGEGVASVSTAASSNDTSSEQQQAPPADLAAGGDERSIEPLRGRAWGRLGVALRDDIVLEGSASLPAEIEILAGLEPMPLGHLVEMTFVMSGASPEAWNGLASNVRDELLHLALDVARTNAELVALVRQRVALATAADVTLTVKSRDGKPFRRCGHLFTGDFRPVSVTAEEAEIIKADPGLIVEGEA